MKSNLTHTIYLLLLSRQTASSTLFPSTTLFRSLQGVGPQHFAVCGDLGARGQQTAKRSEEHTSELQSLRHLVCRLLLEKKKSHTSGNTHTRPEGCHVSHTRHTSRRLMYSMTL